jgi:hypothetical protein
MKFRRKARGAKASLAQPDFVRVFVEICSATSSPAAVHGLCTATLQRSQESQKYIKKSSFTNQITL